MMRSMTALALILLVTATSAQLAMPPPPQNDPFVGIWRLNSDESRPNPSKKDASYTKTIARDGDEMVVSSRTGGSQPGEHSPEFVVMGCFTACPRAPNRVDTPLQTLLRANGDHQTSSKANLTMARRGLHTGEKRYRLMARK